MAVNPAQLKTLVDQQSMSAPMPGTLGVGGELDDEFDDEDLDDPMDEDTSADPMARASELITEWGEFGTTFDEEADALAEAAADIGADLLLGSVPEEAVKEIEKAVDRMPDEIQMGLAKYVATLAPEDLSALGEYVASKIEGADVGLVTTFLQLAAEYAAAEVEVDEDFNAPDEDAEELADAADAPPEAE